MSGEAGRMSAFANKSNIKFHGAFCHLNPDVFVVAVNAVALIFGQVAAEKRSHGLICGRNGGCPTLNQAAGTGDPGKNVFNDGAAFIEHKSGRYALLFKPVNNIRRPGAVYLSQPEKAK